MSFIIIICDDCFCYYLFSRASNRCKTDANCDSKVATFCFSVSFSLFLIYSYNHVFIVYLKVLLVGDSTPCICVQYGGKAINCPFFNFIEKF